ncbi:hypothetical protein TBLA_0E03990 [Henningerozyma blattae CBS 6284]|uniref:Alpha-1,3-mannosyltransferase n=1 Tax=Henningerozyma blattae (strain ATCC 34711 / CBS 6284 / DSM 70876 / NBRC 10599 / NRRL Y-10934 / UCD 77-7) TaxID=1071380 RepID=I2H502_HENB6|nr:hypothetical protein TBLA_0E03990 [Tetrapisispora blattae CBS 6284]CCH61454.1 hypothetical protein TBLA_0E03990 [Tetrapisispora blattae CBS 6284]
MLRRALHSRRSLWPHTRKSWIISLSLVSILLLIITHFTSHDRVIMVQSKQYNNPISTSSRYSGYSKNLTSMRRPVRPEPWDTLISKVEIPLFNMEPVSPLEILPQYDEDIKNKKLNNWNPTKLKQLKKFDLLDDSIKCKFYFRNLFAMDMNWSNDLDIISFDINDHDKEFYEKIEKKFNIQLSEIDKETDSDYYSNSTRYYKRKYEIGLAFQRMRIYESCFMHETPPIELSEIFNSNNDTDLETTILTNLHETYSEIYSMVEHDDYLGDYQQSNFKDSNQFDLEHRMFPFIESFSNAEEFKNVIPRIRRNAKLLPNGHLPILNSENKTDSYEFKYDSTKSIWSNWQLMSLAKRGIVLSFADEHITWALKLLATLRYQNTKLPIQIVMKDGEISRENIAKLSDAATGFLHLDSSDVNATFTELDLSFIDVTNTLSTNYKKSFEKFKSKWVATMFNLFEEFIFLDIDTISYVDMDYYFNTEQYLDSGSLFYRDRTLTFKLPEEKCVGIFEGISPKLFEAKYFHNYPVIQREYVLEQCEKYLTIEEILFRRFFKDKFAFQMESGLLTIDKNQHILPLVMGSFMHLARKVGSCAYGDKEYFWLGFVAAGHKFRFDEMNPAAIGKYDKKGKDSGEICAIQLAHISSDHHLLWLNGGGNNCKVDGEYKIDWKSNNAYVHDNFKSEKELQDYYEKTPVPCDFAIISDDNGDSWGQRSHHCHGYEWCARYSRELKDYSYSARQHRGTLVEFSKEERDYIYYSNEIWAIYDQAWTGSLELID